MGIDKKSLGSVTCVLGTAVIIISNKEMKDLMKIIWPSENSGLLIPTYSNN